MHDIIIIGAGISGLSLAHYCADSGLKTLVMEKNNRPGGAIHTHRFDSGGFWLELGAHTCYNSYGNLLKIIEECGILDRLIPREKVPFRLLVDNQVRSIPSQINIIELLFSAPRIFTIKKQGKSVRSYYSRIVGRRNYKRVFSHIFNAVPCQRADDFPADMLFKRRQRRRDILKKFTLQEGLQTITDSITSQDNIEVLTGTEIGAIQFDKGLYRVESMDGNSYESSILALATPVSVSARLLRSMFPDISDLLSQISVKKVETVGVVVKSEIVRIRPFAGIIPLNDIFYSIVSRDVVRHDEYRGFTFHFKPDMADRDTKLKRIGEVLGIKRDQLISIIEKDNLLPSPVVGHERLINAIDNLIAQRRLLLTGNYFYGLSIEDCVIRSLREFKRLKTIL